MNAPAQGGSSLSEALKRSFGWLDILKMGISLSLGLGVSLLLRAQEFAGIGIVMLCLVALFAVISLDRLRASSQRELEQALDVARKHVSELQHHLSDDMQRVHATVRFEPDVKPTVGYDAATDGVQRASSRICVLGDYCPPSEVGAVLDEPPENRSTYLAIIEARLKERTATAGLDKLTYIRYIQRPTSMYNALDRRASHGGVILTPADMRGDEQALEHCRRVLQIRDSAKLKHRIDIDIRIVPFLPNAPSVLLIDSKEVQFTIPKRVGSSSKEHARQGLLGVLVMQDRRHGLELSTHFQQIFESLSAVSLRVTGIGEGAPTGGSAAL